jgi:pSer/pThr/pTyr-binding forkhead associated (FHA) protein
MFQANAAVNQSTQQEKITEKIAKIVRTSGEHDFKKVRREAQCRICLGEEEDDEVEENPLISPCKCNGTMQYIHLECLKKWLDSKIHTKLTPYTFSYNWKNLVCELWGEKLQDSYVINGRMTYVLDYLRPNEGNYIILESYTNTPHKTIHVLVSDKDNNPDDVDVEYWVGRAYETAIRITDISVSRVHALITYSEGCFYVKDEDAKFGTLMYLKEPIPFPWNKNLDLSLQLGKYLVRMKSIYDPELHDITNNEEEYFEDTFQEDAPYLPHNLLRFLEKDSERLGVDNPPILFHSLEKLKKERRASNKEDIDTNWALAPNPNSTMMFNTLRNDGFETHHNMPLAPLTQIRRRNSDLDDNSMDMINRNLIDMELMDGQPQITTNLRFNTEINSELDRGINDNTTRLHLNTDLGILGRGNNMTNTSPINDSSGEQTLANTIRNRDGNSSRMSMNTLKESRVNWLNFKFLTFRRQRKWSRETNIIRKAINKMSIWGTQGLEWWIWLLEMSKTPTMMEG